MTSIGKATGSGVLARLRSLLARERRVLEQARELASLRAEVETLRVQNERMSGAMRRCVSCEYRLGLVGPR